MPQPRNEPVPEARVDVPRVRPQGALCIKTSAVFPLRDIEVVLSPMKTPVVPKASPETLPELVTYLTPFAPLFRRSTSRESVERYLTGLLTDLPRKNCDTIATAVRSEERRVGKEWRSRG